MKKLILIIVASIISLSCFIFPRQINISASAQALSGLSSYQNKILNEYSQFLNREAGTEGEKQASEYIKNKLDELVSENNKFSAVNSSSVTDGVQKFRFTSSFTGLNAVSQNLVYIHKSTKQTDKKVIIGCNYDSIAFDYDSLEFQTSNSQSINGSVGSVVTLLTLAKLLPTLNLPFNVEIIFFGAGESNNVGSKFYTSGILPETKDNILCMINIDQIAVGKNLYFYIDEVETIFTSFVSSNFSKSDICKVDVVHLGKTINEGENELGLDYSHIALSSDNINFMSNGISSINIFAGDYDEGIIYGRSEFLDKESITYTDNDNLEYIAKNYGENMLSNNLNNCLSGITSLLKNVDFESQCLSAKNNTELFYKIFGNNELIAYLSAVVLIIIIAIIIFIHLKLSLKSYNSNLEPEFLSTVISISQHIDDTCSDESVPKAVSQVVAFDIKKDKTIRGKKKKKD